MIFETLINDLNQVASWSPPLAPIPSVIAWQNQRANYKKWWNWYSGAELWKTANISTEDGSIPYF